MCMLPVDEFPERLCEIDAKYQLMRIVDFH